MDAGRRHDLDYLRDISGDKSLPLKEREKALKVEEKIHRQMEDGQLNKMRQDLLAARRRGDNQRAETMANQITDYTNGKYGRRGI